MKKKSIATLITTLGLILSFSATVLATPITSTNPTPTSTIESIDGVDYVSPNQPQPGFTGYCEVTAEPSLSVRSGPGTGYSIIGSVPYGELVEVVSVSNGWAKIYGDGYGYVTTTYLNTQW